MLQTKIPISVEEVRQLAFQLSQQDLLSLLTDIQERLYISELMAIAESSFQEWNEPYTSPIGVFALMSSVIANQGLGVISNLFSYVLGNIIAISSMIGVHVLMLLSFRIPIAFFF